MQIEEESRLGGDTETALRSSGVDYCEPTAILGQLRARRAASQRLPILDHSGRADPWFYGPPTRGYELAARHLLDHGLTPAPNVPAMRVMWRHGGDQQRLAMRIAELWEVGA